MFGIEGGRSRDIHHVKVGVQDVNSADMNSMFPQHLYVAVTRARKNLWIIESHRPAVHNMLNLWTTHKSEDGRISPLVSVIDRADPCVSDHIWQLHRSYQQRSSF